MGKKLILDEVYIEEVLNQTFRSLVGEQMKRFEILSSKSDIKKACKELVYEKERELKSLFKAFNSGVKFTTPTTKE